MGREPLLLPMPPTRPKLRVKGSPSRSSYAPTGRTGQAAATIRLLQRKLRALRSRYQKLARRANRGVDAQSGSGVPCSRCAGLYAFAPVPYLTMATDGRILDANSSAGKLLGLQPQRLLRRKFTAFLSTKERQSFRSFCAGVLNSRGSRTTEFHLSTAKGEDLIVKFDAIPCPRHGRERLCVSLTDLTKLKRIEQVLQARVNELHSFVQQAPSAMALFDRQMNYLAASDRWVEAYGRGCTQLAGRNLYHSHPDIPEKWRRVHRKAMAGEHLAQEEDLWIQAGGRHTWLRWFVRPWRGADGHIGGIIIVVEDVTERKQVEESLRENAERLRFALETSHTGAWDLSLKDHTAIRSLEHDRIFGYPHILPKWTYEMFLEHVLPRDRAAVNEKFQHAVQTRGDWTFECRIRRVDGAVRWIWAAGRHRSDNAGAPSSIAGIVQDITERKHVEDEVREISQFNQQIIAGANEGIIVYNSDLKYLVWNPFMEKLTGIPANEVIGRHPLEIFPFLQKTGVMAQLERVLAGKETSPIEFHFRVPRTGRSGWVLDSNSALVNADGKITGVIGIIRDITSEKKADERIAQLNRAQAILAAVNRAIAHSDDRARFLTEVCQIAVEQGGFKLAWVGMTQADGTVLPVAQAGPAIGYLKGIQIVTRDEPAGRGPVGTAVRENRTVVIDDVSKNRRMSPWLERAGEFGLRYVAAFPLRLAGKVVGAFQVYASRVEFFSETELALLTQVSDDISFALNAMSEFEARQQAEAELKRSEQNLSNFFDQAPIGLVWLSASGTILRANRAQLDLLGYYAEEYLGHAFTEFSAELSQGQELLERLAVGETVRNMPMTRRCKDGTVRHVLVDANTFWSDGEFQYSSIFLRDITDRVQLEREILQVGEREYRRIAQDLHDGLGQLLAGTAYLAGSLRHELTTQGLSGVDLVERIQEVIKEAISVTRSLARGLHPVEPEPNGLIVALQGLATRTRNLFGVSCRFSCPRPVLIKENSAATHLFRIAQEAVTNAIKHAQAKRVNIRLAETPTGVQLSVRDNGHGMPVRPRKTPGVGLRIMRYRAGMIGGTLTLRTVPGNGTAVVCTVQIPTLIKPEPDRNRTTKKD